MKITTLEVSCFRNLSSVQIEPSPHLNFFLGQNAQGKTSLLEAIAVVANLSSFRNAGWNDFVQRGQSGAKVTAHLASFGEEAVTRENCSLEVQLKSDLERSSLRVQKAFFFNGRSVSGSTDYLARLKGKQGIGLFAVSFHPQDSEVITGDPALKRRFLDEFISQFSARYADLTKNYKKALDQKNALLHAGLSYNAFQSQWEPFESIFIRFASQITHTRLKLLREMQSKLGHYLAKIKADHRPFSLRYETALELVNQSCSAAYTSMPSDQEITDQFSLKSREIRYREFQAGRALLGPHRDQWQVECEEGLLKDFGSQGEIRSAVLALKLMQIDMLEGFYGISPILILDDFSSELDFERRGFMLKFLTDKQRQTFISSTENFLGESRSDSKKVSKKFNIYAGRISKANDL